MTAEGESQSGANAHRTLEADMRARKLARRVGQFIAGAIIWGAGGAVTNGLLSLLSGRLLVAWPLAIGLAILIGLGLGLLEPFLFGPDPMKTSGTERKT